MKYCSCGKISSYGYIDEKLQSFVHNVVKKKLEN